eukprot:m.1488699 g.1488699  ORF g.1488699 m.1488699 type:complete len:131 (+) comp25188_c1_seq1:452-844(+)
MPMDVDTIASLQPFKLVALTNDPDAAMHDARQSLAPTTADLVRGHFWYEYMPPAMNKSSGLRWVATHLGIDMAECVAFGDNSNDFEMLRDAGYGVAMHNARDDVKAVAAKVWCVRVYACTCSDVGCRCLE